MTIEKRTLLQGLASRLLAAAFLFVGLSYVAGCEEQGPFEEAGEDIDRGAEDIGDDIEDAADDFEDAADDNLDNP